LKVVELLKSDSPAWENRRLVIGGKSLGGRIASLVADEAGVAGLVCLGYPFHPVGKPDRVRVAHLRTIRTPTLIVQGPRDPFGTREEVAAYRLSPAVRVVRVEDGDHSFKPGKGSGRTERQNWQTALGEIVTFLEALADQKERKGEKSGK
jgi:predicted alpha/beta-hydrolase family hydrolase